MEGPFRPQMLGPSGSWESNVAHFTVPPLQYSAERNTLSVAFPFIKEGHIYICFVSQNNLLHSSRRRYIVGIAST